MEHKMEIDLRTTSIAEVLHRFRGRTITSVCDRGDHFVVGYEFPKTDVRPQDEVVRLLKEIARNVGVNAGVK